ncbi:MAG: DUF3006 domain-containing protein [Oscillospiraceae bacterium]
MLVIDRIEEGFAVCTDETGAVKSLCAEQIDGNFCAGDVLERQANGLYRVDAAQTITRRSQMTALQNKLWE